MGSTAISLHSIRQPTQFQTFGYPESKTLDPRTMSSQVPEPRNTELPKRHFTLFHVSQFWEFSCEVPKFLSTRMPKSRFPKCQNTTSQYPRSHNFKILNARAQAPCPQEFWYSESQNDEMFFFSLGFRELGVQKSQFQITVSSRSRILKCRNVETLLQRYFEFHDFGASDVDQSTPYQQECRNADSRNYEIHPRLFFSRFRSSSDQGFWITLRTHKS
jgi:hypothetical protein